MSCILGRRHGLVNTQLLWRIYADVKVMEAWGGTQGDHSGVQSRISPRWSASGNVLETAVWVATRRPLRCQSDVNMWGTKSRLVQTSLSEPRTIPSAPALHWDSSVSAVCCGKPRTPQIRQARDRSGQILFVAVWRCCAYRRFGPAGGAYCFGTTNKVIDCAGKVVLMVLVVPPPVGGVTVRSGCATIPAKLALL